MATVRPVSLTALWTAVERGREVEYKDKLLEDPFSLKLGGKEGMKMSEENRKGKPISRFYGIRAKCVDDLIKNCVEMNNITQIVDAASGLDTMSWRLPLNGVKYFEIDYPDILNWKMEQLKDEKMLTPLIPIGCDLTSDDWPNSLIEKGFDISKPSLFITAGLLMYFTSDQLDKFINKVSQLCAPNSFYFADVMTSNAIQTSVSQSILQSVGTSWNSSMDEPKEFFSSHGWKVTSLETQFSLARQYQISIYNEEYKQLAIEKEKSSPSYFVTAMKL